jgi:hypothetical protein
MSSTENETSPPANHHQTTLNRLEAVGALLAAVGIFFLVHPAWASPISSVMIIAMLVVFAFGKLFNMEWVNGLRSNIGLLAVVVWFIELNPAGMPRWQLYMGVAVVLSSTGAWSHRQWRQRAAAPPPPVAVDPDAAYWEETPLDPDAPPSPSTSWLRALRPRSRTAMLHSLAWVFVGLLIEDVFSEWNPDLGLILSIPEFVLALGIWFHQNWIRWMGMIVCAGWLAAVLWFAFLVGINEHVAVIGLFIFTLVRIGLAFRNWFWEFPLYGEARRAV